MDKEIIHKEIDLVQDIVKRMAQNSFQVKAWLVTILGAMIAFEKDNIIATAGGCKNLAFLLNLLLLLPVICFWYLDSFFLSTERLYRELYKWIVKYRPLTNKYLYDLNTFEREIDGTTEYLLKKKNEIFRVMFSKTLAYFYSVPLIFIAGLLIYNATV